MSVSRCGVSVLLGITFSIGMSLPYLGSVSRIIYGNSSQDMTSLFFFGKSVSKSVRSLKCFRVLRLVYKVCEVLGICLEICKWFEILGLSAQV